MSERLPDGKKKLTDEELLEVYPFRPWLRFEEMDLFIETNINLIGERIRDLKFKQEGNDIHRQSLMDKVRKWVEFTFYLCEVSYYGSVRREDYEIGPIAGAPAQGRYGRRK